MEGPDGVKWELGLAGFALGKWDSNPWDWDLDNGNEKNVKNQKWEWDLRIAKWDLEKNINWEMGLVSPFRTLNMCSRTKFQQHEELKNAPSQHYERGKDVIPRPPSNPQE